MLCLSPIITTVAKNSLRNYLGTKLNTKVTKMLDWVTSKSTQGAYCIHKNNRASLSLSPSSLSLLPLPSLSSPPPYLSLSPFLSHTHFLVFTKGRLMAKMYWEQLLITHISFIHRLRNCLETGSSLESMLALNSSQPSCLHHSGIGVTDSTISEETATEYFPSVPSVWWDFFFYTPPNLLLLGTKQAWKFEFCGAQFWWPV